MSTFPRDQRLIADAMLFSASPEDLATLRDWLGTHPTVLEEPTSFDFPPDLVHAAVASLAAFEESMAKIVHLDEDEMIDNQNDRLVVASLRSELGNSISRDEVGVAAHH